MSKRFKKRKTQNIILSVAGSDVIEKITLKSVIIYESRLFCLTWICLGWIFSKSAILKILETTWVSRKIYRFFRCFYQLHWHIIIFDLQSTRTLQKLCVIFWKNPLILKLSLLAQNRWFCTVVWLLSESNMLEWSCEYVSTSGYQYGGWIDSVADMNMLKCYVPPPSINSSVRTTGLINTH